MSKNIKGRNRNRGNSSDHERSSYDQGKQDTLDEIESQVSKWTSIIESAPSEHSSKETREALIKFVVSKIYKDIKEVVRTEDQRPVDLLHQLKAMLLSCTDAIMSELPNNDFITKPEKPPRPSTLDHRPTKQQPIDHTISLLKPRKMPSVYFQSLPPKFYCRITIKETNENAKKGLFTVGEFITYKVETEIFRINYDDILANINGHKANKNYVQKYSLERRNTEFKALCTQLQKELDKQMVPHINTFNERSKEGKVNSRRRQFALWLQYLSNLERVQMSSTFMMFLTNLPRMGGADLVRPGSTTETGANGQRKRIPLSTNLHSSAAGSLPAPPGSKKAQQTPVNTPGWENVSDVFIYAKSFEPLLRSEGSGLSKVLLDGDFEDSAQLRSRVFKDVQIVIRDIAQLKTPLEAAVEACLSLRAKISGQQNAMSSLMDQLKQLSSIEVQGSVENLTLNAVIEGIEGESENLEMMESNLAVDLYEPMDFLFRCCLKAARENAEKIQKSFPSSYITSPQTIAEVYSDGHESLSRVAANEASGGGTVSGSSGVGGNGTSLPSGSWIKKEQDAIKNGACIASAWDSARRAHSSLLMQQMRKVVACFSKEHREAADHWEQIGKNLKKGQYTRYPNVDIPPFAFEEHCTGLKAAFKRELAFFEDIRLQVFSTHARASQVQDDFIKVTSSIATLKSFQALFSRPQVPRGKRRDPTVYVSPLSDSYPNGVIPESHETQKSQRLDPMEWHQNEDRSGGGLKAAETGFHSPVGSGNNPVGSDRKTLRRVTTPRPPRKRGATRRPSKNTEDEGAEAPESHGMRAAEAAYTQPPTPDIDEAALLRRQRIAHAKRSSSRPGGVRLRTGGTIDPANPVNASDNTNTSAINRNNSGEGSREHSVEEEPLPEGWAQVTAPDSGKVYYYHKITRVSRWDRPKNDINADIEAENMKKEDEVKLKQQKLEAEKQQIEIEKQKIETEKQIDEIQIKVQTASRHWKQPATYMKPKDISQMLTTLHKLVPFISEFQIVNQGTVLSEDSPTEIKKSYLRAARLIHPDKLSDKLDIEASLLAKSAFVMVTEAYNLHRVRIEDDF